MTSSVIRATKRVVGYPRPEENVPVVSVADWARDRTESLGRNATSYVPKLFPVLKWIFRYNLSWFTGDVIAGLTVGMVVVPQGMAYAQLAGLPPQYGLYSSFVGVLVYCFFATSRDISIGPVAIVALTISQIIKAVDKQFPNTWSGPLIATNVAFLCGFIVLAIGILRIGWIVEFIPAPAVNGFMTGSAISIIAVQVPALLGIPAVNTRLPPYRIFINSLKGLPRTRLDAAFGITGLVSLYAIRILCKILNRRYPRQARIIFFVSVLRNAFVVIVLTISAWLYTRHRKNASGQYPINILRNVPRGFQDIKSPSIDQKLLKAMGPQLPVATIIIILEHIAIAKSFGRVNGYRINPNQELIAVGVTNIIGSVFGAFPATGSFSRTALKSQCGVRTPAAGIFTAIVVVVALYGLTPAFFWIPNAGLAAIIIHAIADLIASPSQAYSYWRTSPLEFLIWAAAVLVTVFSTVGYGIYTSISASVFLLLVRLAHPRGYFLGKISIHSESQDGKESSSREIFAPLTNNGVLNPNIRVFPPAPGVVIYRLEEALLYPNSSRANAALVEHVKANTRRGGDHSSVKPSDRPWHDEDFRKVESQLDIPKPLLFAVVLDFASIPQIDTTGVQSLVDTRDEVEQWADHPVEFHFSGIQSAWIRRALVAAGFGIGIPASGRSIESPSNMGYDGVTTLGTDQHPRPDDEEATEAKPLKRKERNSRPAADLDDTPLLSLDTPFFHIDLITAVRAAEFAVVTERN